MLNIIITLFYDTVSASASRHHPPFTLPLNRLKFSAASAVFHEAVPLTTDTISGTSVSLFLSTLVLCSFEVTARKEYVSLA